MHMFFVLNDEQQPLHFANVQNPINGLMLQVKALIMLFDVNVYTGRQKGPGIRANCNTA